MYSKNVLPTVASLYTLKSASIQSGALHINAGGYAEIDVTSNMLSSLTSTMLVVVHSSVYSSRYANDVVQVNLSIETKSGEKLEYLISPSATLSGVFNAEVNMPEDAFTSFKYRISAQDNVTIYDWELCPLASADISTIIGDVEQALPRLLYDYNVYGYAIGAKQQTVGLITCYLQKDTDLQGHFTLTVHATERCNVHIRIFDNGITELYTPQVYTLEKGHGSISIPHSYLAKKEGIHTFSVTAQCTNGEIGVKVRGMLYTIDGGYLASRLIDAGRDCVDFTVKQLSIDDGPSMIYMLGNESGNAVLKYRTFKDTSYNWNAYTTFKNCTPQAVEYIGRWTIRNKSDRCTLETHELPVVFVTHDILKDVSGINILCAYMDSDYSNPIVLDTDVIAASACQGFNSMYDIEQDQGLVVVYIRRTQVGSGTVDNVYYRQYLYRDGKYQWLGATALYTGNDAKSVSIHRLPDYRLGICVVTSEDTKWYITDRTYVSTTVKPEYANTIINEALTYVTVADVDMVDNATGIATQNEFSEQDTYHNNFIMTYPRTIVLTKGRTIDDLAEAITIKVNGVKLQGKPEVSIFDNVLLVHAPEDIKGGVTVTIDYNFDCIAATIYNGCLVKAHQTYSWNLPMPTFRAYCVDKSTIGATTELGIVARQLLPTSVPHIDTSDIIINTALAVTVSPLVTSIRPVSDHCNMLVSTELAVTVSQVGTSPI